MQVSIETTSGLERRLTVGVAAEVVDKEVTKRLSQAAKTVRINGFRKGKVPMKVVKQRFGAGVRQEVLGDTINRTFHEAIQTESIRPAGSPDIEPTQFEEGKDLEYVATFEVYPDVTPSHLDGITVVKHVADVGDADLDNMIENLRKGQAQWIDTDAAVEKGFKAYISFEGLKDGEAFDGGTAENHELEIGSNTMIDGFEDAIVGMKPGELKSVDLTFPDDYQVDELKSAPVTFNITLKSVAKQELPKLDEEFFAKFGVVDGDEEKFREDVKANMEREKQKATNNKVKQQVLEGLLESNPIDVPKSLVDGEIEVLRDQAIQQYGEAVKSIDIRALLPDDMFRDQAIQRTSLGLLVSAIVSQEKMTADKDVVRSLIVDAAASYEDPEDVINYYYSDEGLLNSVEGAALEQQVVDFILSKAEVKEEKVSYEEALKPQAPKNKVKELEADDAE